MSDAAATPLPGHRRLRRNTVAVLLTAACLLAPLAITAVWVRNQVLDTNAYVNTVAPLASDPAIDAAVAAEITDALFAQVDLAAQARQVLPKKARFLAVPLSAGLRDYTQKAVEEFLGTSQFHRIWVLANRQAHLALVAALNGKPSPVIAREGGVEVNLVSAVVQVRRVLALAGLHLFDQVKPELIRQRFVIARPASIARIRRWIELLKALAIVLPVLSLLCFGLAIALSQERRRTVLRAGAGLAATCGLAIAAVVLARSYYLNEVVGPALPHDAAGALFDTVARNLRLELKLACAAGLVAVAGAVLAGPSPFAVRLRAWALRTAGKLADGAVGESVTARWVAANKSSLRAVTVVVALLWLLASKHPTLTLLVELGVGVLVVLGALEVLGRPAAPRRPKAN